MMRSNLPMQLEGTDSESDEFDSDVIETKESKSSKNSFSENFHQSIKDGALTILKELKQQNQEEFEDLVHFRKKDTLLSETPLITAARLGHGVLVNWLIDECRVNSDITHNQDDYRHCLKTASILAIRSNKFKKLKEILKYKDLVLITPEANADAFEKKLIAELNIKIFWNDIVAVKKIKQCLGLSFTALINKYQIARPLNHAARYGRLEILNFLISESGSDVELIDANGFHYLEELGFCLMSELENRNLKKVEALLKYKNIILTTPDFQGKVPYEVMYNCVLNSVLTRNFRFLELYHLHGIVEALGFSHYRILMSSYYLGCAITEGDLEKVKSSVTQYLLDAPLFREKMPPLLWAFRMNRYEIAEYLILAGAALASLASKVNNAGSYEILRFFTVNDTRFNENLKYSLKRIDFLEQSLQKETKEEMKKTQVERIEFAKELLGHIKNNLKELPVLKPIERADFLLFISLLLQAIEESKTSIQLYEKLKFILHDREDYILNTPLDYYFSNQLLTNHLALFIARKISPIAPYNLLLEKASMLGRSMVWFNPLELNEDEKYHLPERRNGLRVEQNEIHVVELMVSSAISRLKDGKSRLRHIWFGTDFKRVKPVPLLTPEDLLKLEQYTPSLRQLIIYTKQLDSYSKALADCQVYERLQVLKEDLYAADFKATQSHYVAGDVAYISTTEFYEWWSQLKRRNSKLCRRIRSLNHQHNMVNESLGEVIDILFDDKSRNIENASYCVNLKANMLERILKDEKSSIVLQSMWVKDEKMIRHLKRLSNAELDHLEKNILEELEQKEQSNIVFFAKKLHNKYFYEINLMLLTKSVIKSYSEILPTVNLYLDIKKIIEYILLENNNDHLLALRKMLNHPQLDYLRALETNSVGFFKNVYFAYIQGERTQTNKYYSLLEEALAAQLVKNATQHCVLASKAIPIIKNLYTEHKFMSCPRKHQYHVSSDSRYLKLFETYYSIDTMKENLEKEIAQIKSSVHSIIQ